MKRILLLLLWCCTSHILLGQVMNWDWVQHLSGNLDKNFFSHIPRSIMIGQDDHVYLQSQYSLEINIGDTSIQAQTDTNLILHPSRQFIAHFSAQGEFLEATDLTAPYVDFGATLDHEDNFHLVGLSPTDTLRLPDTTLIMEGLARSIFKVKYTRDWKFLEINRELRTSGDILISPASKDLVSDSQGNIYMLYQDGANFVHLGDSTYQFDNQSENHYLLVKYTREGNIAWLKNFEFLFTQQVFDVNLHVDAQDNLIFAGTYRIYLKEDGILMFGQAQEEGRFREGFIFKYDPNGTRLWHKSFGALNYEDYCNDVLTDADNNIYLTGTFEGGNVDFDDVQIPVNRRDPFLIKLSPNGELIFGKVEATNSSFSAGRNLAIDDLGHIYLAGEFSRFDAEIGDTIISAVSISAEREIFVARYGLNGTFEELITARGDCLDAVSALEANSNGELIVTGFYECDITIGADTYTTNGSISGRNIFLSRIRGQSLVGLADVPAKERSLVVSPNPSSGNFWLRYSGEKQASAHPIAYRLYDSNGKYVKGGLIRMETALDLSPYPDGLYFLQVEDLHYRLIKN